ncbi:zinc finger protein ZAT9 [Diospyros lotus]|uniref:zinc finger protein ZAT9 n=1 Tax=Diospyros lotus TaxID=55363 RepID=UPI0022593964|nr:zinc finger protein ZAT9 [Diospyros lotus]
MERHKCKLCLKSFANGRALGGHMRSHMMNLYLPQEQEEPFHGGGHEESESAASSSSSSSSSSDEEKDLLGYGLRENPKKSVRLVDPEFSFVGSVVLQDRESETESCKNPIRRRSKRIRRSRVSVPELKRPKSCWPEPEPGSSISGTTTEEDVAYCLMMLSRDKWKDRPEPGEELDQTDDELDELNKPTKQRPRGKYKCDTCHKFFRSYQALGGHRASHKKAGASINNGGGVGVTNVESVNAGFPEEKIHECPVCFRVFSSGQALGGHKRSHVTGSSSLNPSTTAKPPSKFGETLIDLNLPAPVDDDEFSAVSDAELLNPIKR